ncbi:MAG: FAD-dependent oxidoreductase [Coriobacteriales bacterium]|jgi:hypothetical protein|nr:FAD-dependent oxidoreductase [Coriobacteriales bacterium]
MSKEITRRNFLKEAVLVAGGATIAAGLGGCTPGDQAPEEKPDIVSDASADSSGIQVGKRPLPNSGSGPLPMQTGKIGPDATPIPPVEAPASWDEEYDVVVVGSGFGGLTAAVYGAQVGSSVALIEKSDIIGGAARHSAAIGMHAGGTKVQNEMGYAWPGDTYDPKAAAAQYQEYCSFSIDNELLLVAIESGAEWIDWMYEQPGVTLFCFGPAFLNSDIIERKQSGVLGNSKICDALETAALEAGVDIRLQCICQSLVQEGNRIVGIKVEESGSEIFLKANKGVILTAGGIGYNLDLLEQYIPSAYMYAVQGGPMPTHTGECFRMGIGVGGDVSGYNSFSCWEGGLDEYWGLGDGNYWHYHYNGAKQVVQSPWLMIDKSGNRLPYYLGNFNMGVLQPGYDFDTFSMGDLSNAASWMSAPGHRAYVIFDSNYKSSLEEHEKTISGIDESRVTVKDDGLLLDNPYVTSDWEGEFLAAVERGAIQKADTLEELAENLGLNPDKVVAAVDHWNELCEQGEDTDLPIAYLPAWLIPLDNPPYYGAAKGGVAGKTMCGLRVNPKMQVMDTEGDPIPGLYAGWTTAGGLGGESNFGGQWGNPTIFGSAGLSGVGGYMAIKGLLESE